MNFASIQFIIFFLIVIGLIKFLKKENMKKVILLSSSYFFYAYWDYRFLLLILISTGLDYWVGGKIFSSGSAKKRKNLLILSLFVNLGMLGFFKYFNFFIESANMAFGGMGINLSTLNIILPVGISFYTFQTLSYTIDIYKKKLEPSKNLLDFAIFVGFFPQLVAGPIVRAKDFLPQLKNKIKITKENFHIGSQIFIFGLIKKILIADRISFFVDDVFLAPYLYDSTTIWLAVVGYSVQIYCDFSGYSDMAIGIARILGFKLPVNFRMPYLAKNLTDFWRRWHISLSSWLRDYLYISLGGNRKGTVRTYVNLFLTMLLGGLWHGASWNFVFWGMIHGVGLAIHKIFKEKVNLNNNFIFSALSWLTTYLSICVAWVFFRSQDFSYSILILKKMFYLEGGISWLYTPIFIIILVVILAHFVAYIKKIDRYIIFDLTSFKGAFILLFILMSFLFLKSTNLNPFIYFQF